MNLPTLGLVASVAAMLYGYLRSSRKPWWDILVGTGIFFAGAIGFLISVISL